MEKTSELGLQYYNIPQWFSEGVSEFISYDNIEFDLNISDLRFPFVPLNQITTYRQWEKYSTNSEYNIYFQSYIVIKFIINNCGVDAIEQILAETKTAEGFEVGFKKATGITVNTLEKLVKNYK